MEPRDLVTGTDPLDGLMLRRKPEGELASLWTIDLYGVELASLRLNYYHHLSIARDWIAKNLWRLVLERSYFLCVLDTGEE